MGAVPVGVEPTAVLGGAAVAHPVEAALAAMEEALAGLSLSAWQGLDAGTARRLCARAARVASRLSAHQMAGVRVLEASDAARAAGASSTGSLLAGDFGGDRRAGQDLARLGQDLASASASATEEAFAAGAMSVSTCLCKGLI